MSFIVQHGREDGRGGTLEDDFKTLEEAEEFRVYLLEDFGEEWWVSAVIEL